MSQRKLRAIDALLPRTRQALLATLLLHPERAWYRSDLARRVRLPPSSLQRELESLTRAGILTRQRDGNRSYFRANPECPFLPEVRGLLAKTSGLVDVLREALGGTSRRIRCALVFGSIAGGRELASSDVDLMVIGDADLAELAPSLRRAEDRLGRPVNAVVYTPRELAEKARTAHHFVSDVLAGDKLFVIGTQHDLEAAREGRPGAGSPPNEGGAG